MSRAARRDARAPHPLNATEKHMDKEGLLQGKLALVTGAGQGNGRALALGLAAAGARDGGGPARGQRARHRRRHHRRGRTGLEPGAGRDRRQACAAAAADVQRHAGPIDVLVNNAGILIREGLDSPRAAENWRRVLDVNLNGSFNMIHAFLGALRATRGVIINVGSIASFAGVGAALGYSPSKGGVKMLTQSLARDAAADGIRVNAIAPGVIETPMTASTREDPAKLASFMQRIPLGRVGQPDDLVGPVVFLASSMARYVTGVSLPVDGGFLAVWRQARPRRAAILHRHAAPSIKHRRQR